MKKSDALDAALRVLVEAGGLAKNLCVCGDAPYVGACSSVGGPFNTYAVLQGGDKIVPVDVYVTGCPPRPENLFYGLLKLQDKIDQMTTLVKRPTLDRQLSLLGVSPAVFLREGVERVCATVRERLERIAEHVRQRERVDRGGLAPDSSKWFCPVT